MKTRWVVAVAVSVGIVGGMGTAIASGPPAPPPPFWVNSDGTVDMAKLPAELPVLNADGDVVGYADPRTFVNDTPQGEEIVEPSIGPEAFATP